MDKIQEITSKLYAEGIEKGKEEANKIVAEAKVLRDQIVEEAKKRGRTDRCVSKERNPRMEKQYGV